MTELVEGEVVTGTDVEPAVQQPATLFRTNDPAEVIEQAAKVADALKRVLQQQGLTTSIQGKPHVRVEGWTTLGSMLGVVPVVAWTRKLENGWEARVEARTLDGRVIGAAEAQCTRDERMWKTRDDYALRSMAQTRATSKALRGPLGFIVTLAGFDATPAEEMPHTEPVAATPAPKTKVTPARANALAALAGRVRNDCDWKPPQLAAALRHAGITGPFDTVRHGITMLTPSQAKVFEGELRAALRQQDQAA